MSVLFQIIRNAHKNGPIHLGGFSFGCIVVQEMLLQLQTSQNDVTRPQIDVTSVFLLDGSTQFTKIHVQNIISEERENNGDLSQGSGVLSEMTKQFLQKVRVLSTWPDVINY